MRAGVCRGRGRRGVGAGRRGVENQAERKFELRVVVAYVAESVDHLET